MTQGRSTEIILIIKWIWSSRLSIKKAESVIAKAIELGAEDVDEVHPTLPREVDARLPGKRDSNSHGARPVH